MKFKNLIKIAKDSKHIVDTPQRHFSFILLKNNIISMGWNQAWKTHPMAAKYGHRFNVIHSELACVKNMQHNWSILEKCRLVNIRIKPNGSIGLSKPCKYCMKLIVDFNIGEIYYTDKDGEFEKL
jgi:deoxycytidylate deaminase